MDLHNICFHCFQVKGEFEVCPHCGFMEGTTPNEPYLLYPGTILEERYLIGTILGIGGFGVTYRAWDGKLGIVVAIKEFYPCGLVNRIPGEQNVMLFSGEKQKSFAIQLERFVEEAKNMAKFNGDKNIVNVYDFFQANHTAYIVMEYLEGMTLKEYIANKSGRLSQADALALITGVLEAVKTIHKKDVIHRDISPDNIFILKDQRVKLLDFGAARFSTEDNKELTQSTVIKMGYAPIEQYRSNMKQGIWTDIYAIGATLYKIVTGVTPEESVDRVEKDLLIRPSKQGASIDLYVEKAIMKAMAVKPEMRFKSVEQMQAALEMRVLADYPEEELKKRKRIRFAVVMVSILTFLIMGSYVGYQSSVGGKETLAGIDILAGKTTIALPKEDEMAEVYVSLIQEFEEKYPEYTVEVEEAENAVLAGADTIEHKADLTLLVDSLEIDRYWFTQQYPSFYPQKNVIPLGFDFEVVYGDQITITEISKKIPEKIESKEELELYTQEVGTSAIYLEKGSLLRKVQEKWPGYYCVIPYYEEGSTAVTFTEEWSIREKATKEEKEIAMLFLHFCLSEYSQNLIHVQKDTAMPVNKKAFDTYIEINPDFEYLNMAMKKFRIR